MPFEFRPYDSPLTGTIADLIGGPARARAAAARQSGEARARAAEIRGQNSAQTWGNIGQIAAGTVTGLAQQHQQRKAEEDEQRKAQWLVERSQDPSKPPTFAELVQTFGPKDATALADGFREIKQEHLNDEKATRDLMAGDLRYVLALPKPLRQQAWQGVSKRWSDHGLPPEMFGDYSDEMPAAMLAKLGEKVDAAPRTPTREIRIRQADGSEKIEIVEDKPGFSTTSAPPAEKAPEAGTLGDALASYARGKGRKVDQLTFEERKRVKAEWEAAGRAPALPRATEPLEAVMGDDGKPVLLPRSQAIGKMPATSRERTTEDERKSVGWYKQMRDAAATIDALEDKLTEKELFQIQTLPHESIVGMINRNQMSEAAKRYFRAFTQFSEARLRSVSGAAISTGEYQSDRQTFGKQYGETPDLAADRKRAREVVIEATRARAGVAMPKEGGGDSGPITVKAPDGQTYTFQTKAQAEAFKLRAGIK